MSLKYCMFTRVDKSCSYPMPLMPWQYKKGKQAATRPTIAKATTSLLTTATQEQGALTITCEIESGVTPIADTPPRSLCSTRGRP